MQQVEYGILRVQQSLPRLYQLAQGGTAVGTGLNSFEGFDVQIADEVCVCVCVCVCAYRQIVLPLPGPWLCAYA